MEDQKPGSIDEIVESIRKNEEEIKLGVELLSAGYINGEIPADNINVRDILLKYNPEVVIDWDTRITEIAGFSFRVQNAFEYRKPAIVYLGELVEMTERDLLATRYLGPKGVRNIKNVLEERGLRLGMGIDYKTPEER